MVRKNTWFNKYHRSPSPQPSPLSTGEREKSVASAKRATFHSLPSVAIKESCACNSRTHNRAESYSARPMRKFIVPFKRLAPLMAALLPLLFACATSFARAGGGEGYHGGGGGSGGGGGGDNNNGLGWIIYFLVRLLLFHPVVGIPVLIIIVIVVVIYSKDQGTQLYQSSVIRRGGAYLDGQQRAGAIEQLRANDPLFDEGAILQRVGVAFQKIQQAWTAQNLSTVRPFISDGVHERFLLQFAEQKDAGWRDHLDGMTINATSIANVETDGVYDVLSVRIAAASVDYRESIATGQRISGDVFPHPFVEVWSLVRRRGAHTLSGRSGLIEGNCPNCGAPVEMNQSANCTHCKALLRSGEYDWVLAEITQEEEWDGGRHGQRPGMTDLQQRDPDFNAVELEDRASVMFWRKATADRVGKIDPLRKIASPQFGDSYATQLRPPPNSQRTFFGDCAVGSVQLLGVSGDDSIERALVEIRWSAHRYVASPGSPPQPTPEEALFHTLFVLARKAGVKTEAGKGISSAHCPNCGAPEPGGTSNACDYCGTVLNDGAHGWVLDDITARNEPRGMELMGSLGRAQMAPAGPTNGQPPLMPDKFGVLAWSVQVAAADGNVDQQERQLLLVLAARQNVAPPQLDRMIEAASRGALQAPSPANADEARAWLSSMAQTALADGKLAPQEFQVLCAVGQNVGLSQMDVKLLINQAKSERYTAAVDALRNQKADRIGDN